MEEGLTVAQQLEQLLTAPPLKPSQELVDILAAYRRSGRAPLWTSLTTLLGKYQAVAVDYEIKEIAKRKFCKQEKFLNVIERASEVEVGALSEDVRSILHNWQELRGRFDRLVGLQLEELS